MRAALMGDSKPPAPATQQNTTDCYATGSIRFANCTVCLYSLALPPACYASPKRDVIQLQNYDGNIEAAKIFAFEGNFKRTLQQRICTEMLSKKVK